MKNFSKLLNVFQKSGPKIKEKIPIVVMKFDRQFEVFAEEGDNLMDVTNKLANEGVEVFGICDKQLACTTCSVHVLKGYEKLKEPKDEELDILYSLEDYRDNQTRMSCQIHLTPEMKGMVIKIPDNVNLQKDARINS